jgi:hypothetical protein
MARRCPSEKCWPFPVALSAQQVVAIAGDLNAEDHETSMKIAVGADEDSIDWRCRLSCSANLRYRTFEYTSKGTDFNVSLLIRSLRFLLSRIRVSSDWD